ncbi:MAG: cell division protein ZapA [Clostridiales bacterium]|nr:cell division protein ZapA [Clostridiales bacterium]
MEKNKVHIVVGGTTYSIITEDDPDYVTDLAEALNNEIRQTMAETPSLSQTQAAVLVALDQMDAAKKASASSDNLRAQIKDYLEDSARARMEADVARHEIERLNREIANLRGKLAQK